MNWQVLTKVYDRIEAEMIKAALEALKIPVELAQESVGGTIPVSFGKFAEIHVLIPKEKREEAQEWLENYDKDEFEVEKE
ncbi:MAG: hypothetical protein HN975_14785 [Anaerolineae bacterium]|jgi:hypothetical protein|nr:hypothetical protein [Anaerolineae bacterium]MBT7072146.1 hypothetical protein [Anaerolineae bacterium]MBT7988334.1 hypothetical protein [Anaerolineae bacterium]